MSWISQDNHSTLPVLIFSYYLVSTQTSWSVFFIVTLARKRNPQSLLPLYQFYTLQCWLCTLTGRGQEPRSIFWICGAGFRYSRRNYRWGYSSPAHTPRCLRIRNSVRYNFNEKPSLRGRSCVIQAHVTGEISSEIPFSSLNWLG